MQKDRKNTLQVAYLLLLRLFALLDNEYNIERLYQYTVQTKNSSRYVIFKHLLICFIEFFLNFNPINYYFLRYSCSPVSLNSLETINYYLLYKLQPYRFKIRGVNYFSYLQSVFANVFLQVISSNVLHKYSNT